MADIEHKDIVDAQRHEPKGAGSAIINHVLTSNGDGTTEFKDPNGLVDVGNLTFDTQLTGFSTASSQQPASQDSPIKVEFGAAQGTVSSPVQLDVAGKLTFNEAGAYRVRAIFQYGRTGSTSQADLFARAIVNGAQIGNSVGAAVDTAGILISSSIESWVVLPAGAELEYELVRDSSGTNAGGLFSATPTVAGWNFAPSASITIDRIVGA